MTENVLTIIRNSRSKDYYKFAERLRYNPDDARLYWTNSQLNRNPGKLAGVKGDKYYLVKIWGRTYEAHRVIWLLVTGNWPKGIIDHRDHDGFNNFLHNLFDVTYGQNQLNRKVNRPSKLGHPGIRLTPSGKYQAFELGSRKRSAIGSFLTLEDALEAQRARREWNERKCAQTTGGNSAALQ